MVVNRRSFLLALTAGALTPLPPVWSAAPKGDSVIADVQAMIRALQTDRAYGPYTLITASPDLQLKVMRYAWGDPQA